MRVEALHALKQPDVSFLDQVERVGPDPSVFERDLHDQPQVREHEFLRRLRIPGREDLLGERKFLFAAEQRVAPDLVEIPRERVARNALEPRSRHGDRERGLRRTVLVWVFAHGHKRTPVGPGLSVASRGVEGDYFLSE